MDGGPSSWPPLREHPPPAQRTGVRCCPSHSPGPGGDTWWGRWRERPWPPPASRRPCHPSRSRSTAAALRLWRPGLRRPSGLLARALTSGSPGTRASPGRPPPQFLILRLNPEGPSGQRVLGDTSHLSANSSIVHRPVQQPLDTCDYLNANNLKLTKGEKVSPSVAQATPRCLRWLVPGSTALKPCC